MPTPKSYTLTGFPADSWGIAEWQSYIAELQAKKDDAYHALEALRAERRMTGKDLHSHLCRVDRLGEFIDRARWEIAVIEKRQG